MPPLRPDPTPDDDRKGKEAERKYMRMRLRQARHKGLIRAYAFPEFVAVGCDAELFMGEFKHQEVFVPPPFNGHGLPQSQFELYQGIERASFAPIRTLLWVNDESQGYDYFGWLDELERADPGPFTTAGTIKKPRRIYALEHFLARSNRVRLNLSA